MCTILEQFRGFSCQQNMQNNVNLYTVYIFTNQESESVIRIYQDKYELKLGLFPAKSNIGSILRFKMFCKKNLFKGLASATISWRKRIIFSWKPNPLSQNLWFLCMSKYRSRFTCIIYHCNVYLSDSTTIWVWMPYLFLVLNDLLGMTENSSKKLFPT